MDFHEQPTTPNFNTPAPQGKPTRPLNMSGDGQGQAPPPQQRKPAISRSTLVTGLAGLGAVGALAIGGVAAEQWLAHTSGATSTPSASRQQIGHLLRRTGFGATPADIATYSALGFTGAVDRLLNPQAISDAALEQHLASLQLDLSKPQQQQRWWLLRMASTQRPLLEKMTLFWHGTLTSSYRKVGGPTGYQRMIVQNQFFRSHAFDTFDNILLGITQDPAMLVYLDLTTSHKKTPNENYARELMELFTLGVGHYTQQDVTAGAAALTGWHVRAGETQAFYNVRDHANQTLTYLGHHGQLNYKDVITILTNHPAAPAFLCHKLFTFFAYENPSADDLKPLIATYHSSNHNIGAIMRTLLLSPQFSSSRAYRSRIKSPTEFVVGAYRGLQINSSGQELPAQTTLMGQPLFDPPNVAGWPADKVSALWLNSGTWMARLNYINTSLLGVQKGAQARPAADLQGIINANHIASPQAFVQHFASYMLDGNIDPSRTSQLVDYFTSSSSSPATLAQRQITLTNGKSYPISRVRGTLYLLMASPEYQVN